MIERAILVLLFLSQGFPVTKFGPCWVPPKGWEHSALLMRLCQ